MEVTQGAPFESFGLSEATMRAVRNKHYTISTPVQAGCIPPMLAGKDVIAKAPTGTGILHDIISSHYRWNCMISQ